MADYSIFPPEWQVAFDLTAPGFTEAAQSQQASPDEPWWQTALRAVPTLIMANHQRELMMVQIERAKQGLPPLDISQYGPSVGVSVGVDPQLKTLLVGGGLALLAVLTFSALRR